MRRHDCRSRNASQFDLARRGAGCGRVIPHAGRFAATTSAAFAFPIAVVESAFGAHSMAATGAS
ncbi:MAG: hypothetical protein V3T64_11830, partial [Myxococcota bacterium]